MTSVETTHVQVKMRLSAIPQESALKPEYVTPRLVNATTTLLKMERLVMMEISAH
jgi:hypothetical protein